MIRGAVLVLGGLAVAGCGGPQTTPCAVPYEAPPADQGETPPAEPTTSGDDPDEGCEDRPRPEARSGAGDGARC